MTDLIDRTQLPLEDDGSLTAWLRRRRDPLQFQDGVPVRTSPKRTTDPIDTGVCVGPAFNDGGDWKVRVRWTTNKPADPISRYTYQTNSRGEPVITPVRDNIHAVDLRSLYPLTTY